MRSRTICFTSAAVGLLALAGFGLSRAAAEEMATEAKSSNPKNFMVAGVDEESAKLILAAAEKHRKALAELWLGKPLPELSQPSPIYVSLCGDRPGGSTTFDFRQSPPTAVMSVSGTLPMILESVLPHEVAHTVLADYFRHPIPRWADEGAAILGERGPAPKQYDRLARRLLNDGRAMRLSHLFVLRNYPPDLMPLYTQGYSVSRFLVDRKDRATYLKFIKSGIEDGWDTAASQNYGFETVNALEEAWIASVQKK